jgi:hypothetical protein
MNRRDATTIIEQGYAFRELRDLMFGEFDGTPSKAIPEWTKQEVFSLCRGCIDGKEGLIHPKSHDALVAILALMEFGPEHNNTN